MSTSDISDRLGGFFAGQILCTRDAEEITEADATIARLTAERDAARAEVDQLCQAVEWLLEPEPSRASRAGARRILDSARKAPATPTGSGS